MRRGSSPAIKSLLFWVILIVVAGVIWYLATATVAAQSAAPAANQGAPAERTARHFEQLAARPAERASFLREMPKGGDLHSHLSGAVYAESYIRWSAAAGHCINQATWALTAPPCDATEGLPPVSAALTNGRLYRQMIDNWSMRYSSRAALNGHDQFFDAFGKFGLGTVGQAGAMLAEVVSRAARGRVSYVELMLTADNGASSALGQQVGWDGNAEATLATLVAKDIASAATSAKDNLRKAEAQKDDLLKCGTPQADPGCGVVIRYVSQVSRGSALGAVFAQMVTGFALASDPDSKVVSLNLVQFEDGLASMQNFPVHMQMLAFLRPRYPRAKLTLHAGELAPGVVPPDGLAFHVRDSVMVAGADRIGHGADVLHETDAIGLLKEMARRKVMVEICLSSNDGILGLRGKDHPLASYIHYGVPVALATDDEGVARSDISMEFLKAANEQGLGYTQLKSMARTSLEYAFIAGASLWRDARTFALVAACAKDRAGQDTPSSACGQFLAASDKARLQWTLERDLAAFERKY